MLTLERINVKLPREAFPIGRSLSGMFINVFLIFISINLYLSFVDTQYIISDRAKNANNFDFSGLRKECFRTHLTTSHEIVLLGSSLFTYPFWSIDKKLNVECSEPNHHHKAIDLSKKLKMISSHIISLAVGGAMISDYYLLLNKRLSNSNSLPEWIIVDCAPRAFYDGELRDPSMTPIFEYFFDKNDLPLLGNYYLPSFYSRLEFLVKHYCYLYSHRRWLRDTLTTCAREIFNPMPKPSLSAQLQQAPRHVTNQRMLDSLQDYRGRYFAISDSAIQSQMKFLNLIVELCKKKHIKLLVLNMPLTVGNKNLLTEDFYTSYKNQVASIVENKNSSIYFLDLDNTKQYIDSDFDDSVHLNAFGASKLENQITDFLRIHSCAPI